MEGERFFLVYGACWRNFGGEVGRYIVDGCGQFAQDAQGSINCEACGCDKSFHLNLNLNLNLAHINIHNNNGGRALDQPSNSQESVITEVENNVTPIPLVDDKMMIMMKFHVRTSPQIAVDPRRRRKTIASRKRVEKG